MHIFPAIDFGSQRGLANDLLCRILRQAMILLRRIHRAGARPCGAYNPVKRYGTHVPLLCLPSSLRLLDWLRTADREGRSAFQDSGHLKRRADANIPKALQSRVIFMLHSFFEPQGTLA